jgi:DDE superfamily endonuclease
MKVFFETHAERLTIEQLPAYSPDFNPIEHLWKKVKKEATHLKHFPGFTDLQHEVDRALLHFAQTPREITVRSCTCTLRINTTGLPTDRHRSKKA